MGDALVRLAMKMGLDPDVVELAPRTFTKEARKKAPTAYDDAFPVPDLDALGRAIQSYGRAPEDKRATLKAFLARRARELGASDEVKKRISALGSGG